MTEQRHIEHSAPVPPASPMDPYLAEALRWLQDRQHLSVRDLAKTMSDHLSWPLGFAEVVTQALLINHLVRTADWEPSKLAVSDVGVAWLNAHQTRD